jgi:N-acetylneuraminate synthase
MQKNMFKISKILGLKRKAVIISELGINHFGDLKIAKKMVDNIYDAGGRIVKNQSHILNEEMSKEAKKIKPDNADTSIFNVIKKNMMSFKDEVKLKSYVEKKKMVYISTPFSILAAKRLNDLKVKLFKIGSGEFNNFPLLNEIVKYKKPMILSTGMNNLKSIKETVNFLKKKNADFMLMHCISDYPVKNKDLQLSFISKLKKIFPKLIIGYSDHSKTIIPSIAAISLGAEVIEKHFVLSKNQIGPDVVCSMDKNDLQLLIQASDIFYKKKNKTRTITSAEKKTAKFAFASVVSIKNIKKGERFDKNNIWVKRPGTGYFAAKKFYKVIGKISKNNISKDTQLKKSDVC